MGNSPVPSDAGGTASRGSSSNNTWIWLVVFLPLVWVALLFAPDVVGAASIPKSGSGQDSMAPIVLWAAISAISIAVGSVLFAALGVFAARRDWLQLRSVPIERPFGWPWQFTAVVGAPVYAIGRSVVVRRRTGRGLATLVTSIVVTVVAAVFIAVWVAYRAVQVVFLLTLIATGP